MDFEGPKSNIKPFQWFFKPKLERTKMPTPANSQNHNFSYTYKFLKLNNQEHQAVAEINQMSGTHFHAARTHRNLQGQDIT